jgi:hypothetical protein
MNRFRMTVLAAVAVLASLATGCAEPHSMLLKRPENQVADKAVTQLWADDIKRVAQDGDWLLTRGYFITSDAVSVVTGGEDISHASIYDARKGTIIEAVNAGVREITLEELLRRNHHVILVRPTNMTAAERSASVTRARSQIGAGFDHAGLFGMNKDERFYCSELVWWASKGDERTGAQETVIQPSELMNYSEVVYWSGERTDQQILDLAVERQASKRRSVATR